MKICYDTTKNIEKEGVNVFEWRNVSENDRYLSASLQIKFYNIGTLDK